MSFLDEVEFLTAVVVEFLILVAVIGAAAYVASGLHLKDPSGPFALRWERPRGPLVKFRARDHADTAHPVTAGTVPDTPPPRAVPPEPARAVGVSAQPGLAAAIGNRRAGW